MQNKKNLGKNTLHNKIHKEGWIAGFRSGSKIKKQNIGMLRQWLNEDRITDTNKMVTNEDLENWLNK